MIILEENSANKNAHARTHSKVLWSFLGLVCIQKFGGLLEMACRIPTIISNLENLFMIYFV